MRLLRRVGPASLGLADVLVDDVAGDGLQLLLLPHQHDALVDEHVLLLQEVTSYRERQVLSVHPLIRNNVTIRCFFLFLSFRVTPTSQYCYWHQSKFLITSAVFFQCKDNFTPSRSPLRPFRR